MQATQKKKNNLPVRANQYLADPRQLTCWKFYIDPKSPTFSNAYRSAIRAGYAKATAIDITSENWWVEKSRRIGLLSKAERNLEEALELPIKTQAMGAFGPIYETRVEKVTLKNGKTKLKKVKGDPVMVFNPSLINIRTNTAQFVAERVGRARYGRKDEGGGNIYNVVIFTDEQRRRIAQRVIRGRSISRPESNGISS